ncbi:hypothetical protein QTP88_021820 [Uroleucon formosanum]
MECSINTSDTIILYGKCDNQRQSGTGFAVHKSLVPAIKEFRDVNPRISVLTIRAQWFDVSLISVHAPTEDKPQEEKETFYDDLESTINTLPNNNIQILLGDLNAKIVKETAFKPTIGLHSLHDITNYNGLRLVNLATGKGFIIKSTMFPHKNFHKGTWRSPDGRYTNQIDHVLINSRFSNCIQDVRTVRGADCDSDHYLVKVKMKLKLKKKERREKMTLDNYDISKLRDQILGNVFKDEMRSQIDKINPSMMDTVDNRWRIIQNTIKSVSETVIGMKKKNPSKPWFNKVCEVALSKRKNARNTWLNESSNEEKERRFQETNNFLAGEDGTLITSQQDIEKKWTEYFKDLLNCDEPAETFLWTQIAYNEDNCPPPTRQEIEWQIKRLKNNKSSGSDGIQSEILKALNSETIMNIHKLMEHIWEEEVIPQDWNSALICPIYKKGDPLNCNNYRGIALLNVSYKILAYCILDRIKPRTEELLGDYQCGFRQNRSTTDQIFNLRQIFQKAWEYDKNLCVLFVDFKKAYDSIHRPSLINIMKEFSFPKKLINLVEATLKYTEIEVKAANRASEPVRVTMGLRQGDALSPVLFNLVLEKVIREANITGGFSVGQTTVDLLAYADDIAILGNNVEEVKSSCRKLMKTAGKVGLQINDEKTEYILVNRREVNYRQGEIMEVDNHSFKRVSHFNYLGSILTNDNNIKVEIDTRLKKGNNCYYGLGKILSAKAVSKNLKVQIYTTLIRPVVLYGSETWPLRKAEQMMLEVFERKILRRIFGPCKDDQTGEWRKRHDQELQNLFQRPDITKEISVRRLRWAGHAWRKQGSIIRTVIENNPAGKRPSGRPRLRWEDCVIKDVGRIGANLQWREEAEDRNRWRSIYLEDWS